MYSIDKAPERAQRFLAAICEGMTPQEAYRRVWDSAPTARIIEGLINGIVRPAMNAALDEQIQRAYEIEKAGGSTFSFRLDQSDDELASAWARWDGGRR